MNQVEFQATDLAAPQVNQAALQVSLKEDVKQSQLKTKLDSNYQ